eukprot:5914383-Alexandrium_andersonii.AAC.1
MSASLVGSEMCIRDRSLERLRRYIFQVEGMRCGLGGASWAAFGGCLGAVSYTHLTLPTICSV